MLRWRNQLVGLAALLFLSSIGVPRLWAGDLRITIPRHTAPTLVQRLNREGVEAVRKQQYEKAEALFLKAYLYDPADPFTLNNLGYISEMQGQLERALKFYQLASEQGGEAAIDRSNAKQLEGKPMDYAVSNLKNAPMRVNHMNVEAIQLLGDNRNREANLLLEKALALDPQNSFTLNNLGVAKESLGDYEGALRYYSEAAQTHSSEPIVVTLNRSWRGKPVSEMAEESAQRLKKRLKDADTPEAQAALLSVRGVSAANRNDWQEAKQDFLKAYALDPASAFSLNNVGYVSERDGDIETAHFFYRKAQRAEDANARVGLASEPSAEGKHLVAVATDSDQKVAGVLDRFKELRQTEPGDVELKHRDGSPVDNASPAPQQPSSPDLRPPAPETLQLNRRNTPPSGQPSTSPQPPLSAPAPQSSTPEATPHPK
jgi:Flp pilus assembly protein TadD